MTVVILNRKHRRFVTTIALLVFSSMLTHTIYRHIFPYAPKSGFKVRPPLAKKQSVKVENHVPVAYVNAFDDVTTNFPTVPKVIINLSPVSKIYQHLFPKSLIKEHTCDINAGTDLPKHPINCVWRDQILYGRPPDGIIWFGKPKPETLRYYKSGQGKTFKQPFIINPIKTRQIYFSLEPIVPKLFIPEVGDQIDLFFGFEDENIKAANNVPVSRLSSKIDRQIKRYKAPATSQRQFQMAFYSPACRYLNSNIITYIENMKKYMPIHIFGMYIFFEKGLGLLLYQNRRLFEERGSKKTISRLQNKKLHIITLLFCIDNREIQCQKLRKRNILSPVNCRNK